jgi:hypothetical protein
MGKQKNRKLRETHIKKKIPFFTIKEKRSKNNHRPQLCKTSKGESMQPFNTKRERKGVG